jgi:hypothetical protein
MSRVVAWKEPTWFGENEERAAWHMLCRAYEVPVTRLERDEKPEFAPGEIVVVMDEQGTTSLDEFLHPPDAVYVFGRTHQNDLMKMPHDHSVRIVYPGKTTMFGITACAITLADRRRKAGLWRSR